MGFVVFAFVLSLLFLENLVRIVWMKSNALFYFVLLCSVITILKDVSKILHGFPAQK